MGSQGQVRQHCQAQVHGPRFKQTLEGLEYSRIFNITGSDNEKFLAECCLCNPTEEKNHTPRTSMINAAFAIDRSKFSKKLQFQAHHHFPGTFGRLPWQPLIRKPSYSQRVGFPYRLASITTRAWEWCEKVSLLILAIQPAAEFCFLKLSAIARRGDNNSWWIVLP